MLYILGTSRGRAGIRGEIDSLRAQSGADDDMRTPRAGETLREFYRFAYYCCPEEDYLKLIALPSQSNSGALDCRSCSGVERQ